MMTTRGGRIMTSCHLTVSMHSLTSRRIMDMVALSKKTGRETRPAEVWG